MSALPPLPIVALLNTASLPLCTAQKMALEQAGFVVIPVNDRPAGELPPGAGMAVVAAGSTGAAALLGAARARGLPTVLIGYGYFSPAAERSPGLPGCGADVLGLRADAYCLPDAGFVEAVRYAASPRPPGGSGGLRLVYRGDVAPLMRVSVPLGSAVPLPIGETLHLGRGVGTAVTIHSPHVARRHVILTATPDRRLLVRDASSTNGTWIVDKEGPARLFSGSSPEASQRLAEMTPLRVLPEAILSVGDDLIIAGAFRYRVE